MDRKPAAISAEMPSSAVHAADQDIFVDREDLGDLAASTPKKFAVARPEPDARLAKPKAIHEHHDRHSCASCNQEFDSRLALSIHVGRVHKECVAGAGSGDCGNGGDSNSTTNKRNHTCHLCDKSFYSASYLSQHLRIHSGLKPYGCQVCSRRFTQLSHLQQHRRTHTGERPYKCKQPGCTKAFSQLSNLQSHSRSHMTDKTYKCTSCYKCFLDKESLFNHMSTHLGTRRVRAFACHACDKSYTQDTYLQNHIKVKHSGSAGITEKTRAARSAQYQHQQQQQQILLAEAADPEPLPPPAAPRQAPAAELLRNHLQHAGELAGSQLQQQLLQRHEMPVGSLLLASFGVTAAAAAAAGDRRFLHSHHGRQQLSPSDSGSRCDGSSSGGGVPVSVICPAPAMSMAPHSMSMAAEQALTAVPPEVCPTGSPHCVSDEATTPAALPLVAAGPHDMMLSASSEKEQVAAVGPTSVLDQIGGCRMQSPALRSHMDSHLQLTALGDSCKVDPNWQFAGPGVLGDGGCPNYLSQYMHADLHALQISLSQHEPYRWPSCSAELDQHGFSMAPGGGGRVLANPPLAPPYWFCSDGAYKPNGALGRGLFGGSGSIFDGIGGAMSPYGFAVTPSVASVEPFAHSDLLSLAKVPGHSGFGNVHFPGL